MVGAVAPVVYLVQDLLFTSKIRETAAQLGVEVEGARDAAGLAAAARGARLVLLDLRRPDALGALELLAADPATAAVPSVGFVDHERTDVMQAAAARGCGRVLAKGRFASELPALLVR
jgi:CheY-like chemotaxis protein